MAINYATLKIQFFSALAALGDAGGTGGTAEVLADERWGNGTAGAFLVNNQYHDIRNLGMSANEDIDLQALVDGNGVTQVLTDVAVIIFEAASTNGDEILITPAAGNPWIALLSGTSPVLHLLPGMKIAIYVPTDPALVVSGASLGLNFANQDAGGSADYTLTILGRDA